MSRTNRPRFSAVACLLTALFISSIAHAAGRLPFRSSFETGDFSEWTAASTRRSW